MGHCIFMHHCKCMVLLTAACLDHCIGPNKLRGCNGACAKFMVVEPMPAKVDRQIGAAPRQRVLARVGVGWAVAARHTGYRCLRERQLSAISKQAF